MHLLAHSDMEWDPFPPVPSDDQPQRAAANRAIAVSAIGLGLTGMLELAIAVLGGSVALLSDALHNLSDVSTSAAMFVGFRFSKRRATSSHPYGYERAEDLAGAVVAIAVWASAVAAAVVSVRKLTGHGQTTHLDLGMAAAAVGIVGNQVVARYKRRVGRQINSRTLLADAKHSWLDALSSAGALAGLVGVALGLRWADGVAGLVVTLFIAHAGYEITSDVVAHLMDGVEPEVLARAETASLTVPGVDHVHVRGRWSGRSLVLEVEGFVTGGLRVTEAQALGRQVQAAVAAVTGCRAVLWSSRAVPSGGPRGPERRSPRSRAAVPEVPSGGP